VARVLRRLARRADWQAAGETAQIVAGGAVAIALGVVMILIGMAL
jgi:hypothetical protein